MTLDEKFGTNINTPHKEKYRTFVNGLGYKEIKLCIPYPIDAIKEALSKGDKYLNTLPMEAWDTASGVILDDEQVPHAYTNRLTLIYKKAGITVFSQSEGVCILKEAARMWAEEG